MEFTEGTRRARKLIKCKRCGAVIVAAGVSARMGGADKIMASLGGEAVIARTVRAVASCDVISEIVVVTRADLIVPVMDVCCGVEKVQAVVAGGATRQESVLCGLGALSSRMQLVAVHDGARPLVTWQLIDRVVRAANTYGAAVPAVPVRDTVKLVRGRIVESTPDRAALFAVQTPQVFDADLLRGALRKAQRDNAALTDDSGAVERLGMSVKVVEGDERNIKITTPPDLKLAELLLEGAL